MGMFMVSNGKTESSVKRIFSGNILTSLDHESKLGIAIAQSALSYFWKFRHGVKSMRSKCLPPLLDGQSPTFCGEDPSF